MTVKWLVNIPPLDIPPHVVAVIDALIDAGGRPYIVGGSVRNQVARALGVPVGRKGDDWDIEVYGLAPNVVQATLAAHWKTSLVGARFGIFVANTYTAADKLDEVQVSVPRVDSRLGAGHTNFKSELIPDMSIEDAAQRRDFAWNGFSYDYVRKMYLDPCNGVEALKARVASIIDPVKFGDDMPVRGWRAFKFVGRHDLTADDALIAYLRAHVDEMWQARKLSNIWKEWLDWAAFSVKPSRGIDLLWRCGWLHEIPILWMMVGCHQEPAWHPEGSVFSHTQIAIDKAAEIAARENLSKEDSTLLVMAVLLHDCGKRECTIAEGGRIRSPNHDVVGADLAFEWLLRMDPENPTFAKKVSVLIREHMAHIGVNEFSVKRRARRLAARLGQDGLTLRMLGYVVEADHSARPPLPGGLPDEFAMLLNAAEVMAIVDSRPQPLVLGRHLIADLKMTPGVHFSLVLNAAYDAQLDGHFNDLAAGIDWVKSNFTNLPT